MGGSESQKEYINQLQEKYDLMQLQEKYENR